MDYQGNSNKAKAATAGTPQDPALPEKKIEKVVTGTVVQKKKSLGQKAKDLLIQADFRSVVSYIVTDVVIPATKSMMIETAMKGMNRVFYGANPTMGQNPYGVPRSSYGGSPIMTNYRQPQQQQRPMQMGPQMGQQMARPGVNDFIIPSREEANLVLQKMHDIINMGYYVSVADFYELMGVPSTPVDLAWGWQMLHTSHVQAVREGYLIVLPPVEILPKL